MSDVSMSADGVSIHYEVHGEGAPALVFVHGWSCDRSYWDRQVSHFAQRYRVVTIDLAGHGDSGFRSAYTMAAFGEDVVSVVDALELERVVLIGHSMGGPVIVEAARRMPNRVVGLVGADTFKDVERTRTREQIEERLAAFRASFAEATRDLVRGMFAPDSDPALVEQIVTDMSAALPEVGIRAMEALFSNDQKLRAGLLEVTAPKVAINSGYRPTNLLGAQRYGIETFVMSGVGHFVMLEDAETFNGLLGAAVKRFASQETV